MFFYFEKKRKKNVKNVRRPTYSFTAGPLNHSSLNTQLPKVSTGKSPTSHILLRNSDTRNYAT